MMHYLRGLKSSVAGGLDLTLTGTFLAGYWFGYKWGLILGIIFMITYYAISVDFGLHSVLNTIVCALMSITAATMSNIGMPIPIAGITSVIIYCVISDLSAIIMLGERNLFSLFMFDFGAIFMNYIFFKMFF